MQSVIVTDGDQRSSLAVVRSLGKLGYTVHTCSTSRHSIAGSSKYAQTSTLVADSLNNPEAFIKDLAKLAQMVKADVIIPITEPSVMAVLGNLDRLPEIKIPFVDLETFKKISDKAELLRIAPEYGIYTPEQISLNSSEDSKSLDLNSVKYPVVIKPGRSIAGNSENRTKLSVVHAANANELDEELGKFDERAYPLLLQQRIVGPGVGIFVLIWDGEVLGTFSHRRIREHPPAGGVSVLREAHPMDNDLLEKSIKLLTRWGWQGVAMVEYKVDENTGKPYLMEINGRFWGSLQLAIDSGVDFPRLLLEASNGNHPKPVTSYDVNTKSRWEWGDVSHLYMRLRYSDAKLSVPKGFPSKLKTLLNFLKWDSNTRLEILRFSDLRPFLVESVRWFQDIGH